MPINESDIQRDYEASVLSNAFAARLMAMQSTGQRLVEEYRHNVAETLLSVGITLIPSDHLTDNQFVVSRGVYEAAKKACNEIKDVWSGG